MLLSRRYLVGSELELQEMIARVLSEAGITFERERSFGAAGRIDFYLPSSAAGLELKVDGSAGTVLRQLHRYADVAAISTLLLGTTHARLAGLPSVLRGKPLRVLMLSGGGL